MDQKKVGWIVYAVLLLAAAFTLGWFAGNQNTRPQIQVTVSETTQQPLSSAGKVPQGSQQEESGPSGLIDLNTAGQSDLEILPGIGTELASRIIAYRETIGAFVSKEQIMDVEGIGEKRYSDMEHLITVGGNP